MRTMRLMAAGLFGAATLLGPISEPVSAGFGFFCKKDCCPADTSCPQDRCCKPKRHCCLCPPDAPDAEIGFAIPGVVRPGQAVRLNESALNRAFQDAAAKSAKSAEAAPVDKSVEDRVGDLETRIGNIDARLDRLTRAVEALADKSK